MMITKITENIILIIALLDIYLVFMDYALILPQNQKTPTNDVLWSQLTSWDDFRTLDLSIYYPNIEYCLKKTEELLQEMGKEKTGDYFPGLKKEF